jgi:hypothetical protein
VAARVAVPTTGPTQDIRFQDDDDDEDNDDGDDNDSNGVCDGGDNLDDGVDD